ncbi:replication protein [Achromobacter sp. 2789STDY5608628]|uniref:replication protein n=1 Tax=Achromobacter sp. 2789STDY5608628 TaxID=1806493 RepID=UPI0006C36437|nr:replication protein [Achromobacter sp. 2789STDY5608628]CUJ67660.1 phage replication protein O%2C N-terminal domain [Achromobacter sp. 2789STDY5608628]
MTHDNASPQVEEGHTRLANELLEAMCCAGFSARQWAVVMAVVRKTYGYGKKADDISLGQLASMTGIAKPHISRAVNDLIESGVVRRSVGTFGHSLSLNKHYKQWRVGAVAKGVTDLVTKGLPKEQRGLPIQEPTDGVTDSDTTVTETVTGGGVTDSVKLGLPIQEPQKETLQKKEKHPPIPPKGDEGDPEGFAEAWAAYPKRQGGNPRATAVKAWKARLCKGVAATEMIAGVRGYAAYCRAEGKEGTSFVLMAATFFGPDLRFRDFSGSPAAAGEGNDAKLWYEQVGFSNPWEAENAGCTEGNRWMWENRQQVRTEQDRKAWLAAQEQGRASA